MIGPGKYDAECTAVREGTKAKAAIVAVIDGDRGSGFSMQGPPGLVAELPKMLRDIAAQIDPIGFAAADIPPGLPTRATVERFIAGMANGLAENPDPQLKAAASVLLSLCGALVAEDTTTLRAITEAYSSIETRPHVEILRGLVELEQTMAERRAGRLPSGPTKENELKPIVLVERPHGREAMKKALEVLNELAPIAKTGPGAVRAHLLAQPIEYLAAWHLCAKITSKGVDALTRSTGRALTERGYQLPPG